MYWHKHLWQFHNTCKFSSIFHSAPLIQTVYMYARIKSEIVNQVDILQTLMSTTDHNPRTIEASPNNCLFLTCCNSQGLSFSHDSTPLSVGIHPITVPVPESNSHCAHPTRDTQCKIWSLLPSTTDWRSYSAASRAPRLHAEYNTAPRRYVTQPSPLSWASMTSGATSSGFTLCTCPTDSGQASLPVLGTRTNKQRTKTKYLLTK